LAECILGSKRDAEASFLTCAMLGHAGDGNFHAGYLLDPNSAAELAEAERLNDLMVNRAIALGGTCTGEHGIGLGKRASLVKEHGEAVEVMRQIKQALDPLGIMNPGKIF
jgi:D-lactate dehydrogenase (cytochrome)